MYTFSQRISYRALLVALSEKRQISLSTATGRGRMIFHFSVVQVHFIFLLIEFHCTFSISSKMLYLLNKILLYFDEVLIGRRELEPLFVPSSVSLSYFIRAVPMQEFISCMGILAFSFSMQVWENTRSCVCSPFPIAIPNTYLIFSRIELTA